MLISKISNGIDYWPRTIAINATVGFLVSTLVTLALILLGMPLFEGHWIFDVIAVLSALSCCGFLISLAALLIIIAFKYWRFRFSLRTLLALILIAGTCVSFLVLNSSQWLYAIGVLGLVGTVTFILIGIASYDPSAQLPPIQDRKTDSNSSPPPKQ